MSPRYLVFLFLLMGACTPPPQQNITAQQVDKIIYNFTTQRLHWNLYEHRRENPVPDNHSLLMQIVTSSGLDWQNFTAALEKHNKPLFSKLALK